MSGGQSASIPVVVACTDRKRGVIDQLCLLRRHLDHDVSRRLGTWIPAVSASACVAARDLYVGEHWAISCGLSAGRPEVSLWIASAGYGLIPDHARVQPYGATFSFGHPDSVDASRWPDDNMSRAWWAGLAEWQGPHPGAARSLTHLAAESTAMIVAVSPPYLEALRDDLVGAQAVLDERLLVVSAGARAHLTPLALLPVTGQLRTVVGGSMQSVNARAAALIVERADLDRLDRQSATAVITDAMVGAPALPRFDRTPLVDDEVRDFLRAAIDSDPTAGWTVLHRVLRQSGRACEQKRFRRLFYEIKECHV